MYRRGADADAERHRYRPVMPRDPLDDLLREQIDYYRARSPEYDADALHAPGGDELIQALSDFRPAGEVLELACGTGAWTRLLVEHADAVTAVDASPEMLAATAARVSDPRLRLI